MGIFVPKINHLAMIEVSYKCYAINFFFFSKLPRKRRYGV